MKKTNPVMINYIGGEWKYTRYMAPHSTPTYLPETLSDVFDLTHYLSENTKMKPIENNPNFVSSEVLPTAEFMITTDETANPLDPYREMTHLMFNELINAIKYSEKKASHLNVDAFSICGKANIKTSPKVIDMTEMDIKMKNNGDMYKSSIIDKDIPKVKKEIKQYQLIPTVQFFNF